MIDNLSDSTRTLVVSYLGVRRAIGLIGLLLPIALVPGGWLLFGVELQDNMSSYYHTPVRDIFVGAMCAISSFLFCYRGYDWIERWTGYCGSVAALGVALFPLDANSDPLFQTSLVGYTHTACGGAFFLTLAFYSLYHFPKSTGQPDEDALLNTRNLVYRTSGIVILLSMLAMGAYLILIPSTWKTLFNRYNFLLWMEWVAVWAFAAAWLTKGHTIVADIAVNLIALPTRLSRRALAPVPSQLPTGQPSKRISLAQLTNRPIGHCANMLEIGEPALDPVLRTHRLQRRSR